MHHLHVSEKPDVAGQQAFQRLLPTDLTVGFGRPAEPHTTILIDGSSSETLVESLPLLRHLIVPWAGIPEKTAAIAKRNRHLQLYNLHHNDVATAETAFALLWAVAKWVVPCDQALREGRWVERNSPPRSVLLAGRHAVIFGFGAIGRALGRLCQGAGLEVTGVKRNPDPEAGFSVVSNRDLSSVLPTAQVFCITAPLTPETRGSIGARELAMLPDDAILINVGRGPVVEEEALYSILRDKRILGAGLDVWYKYPGEDSCTLPSRFPFHELDNVVLSPHRGGFVRGNSELRWRELARLVAAIINDGDTSANRVDPERGY